MDADGVTIQVPLQRRAERRASERFVAAMPVKVDGEDGTTRDFSETGLSFHSDHGYELGARINVVIEYILDGHHYPLRCQAEVVRVHPSGSGFTVGARLLAETQVQDLPAGGPEPAARPLRRVL